MADPDFFYSTTQLIKLVPSPPKCWSIHTQLTYSAIFRGVVLLWTLMHHSVFQLHWVRTLSVAAADLLYFTGQPNITGKILFSIRSAFFGFLLISYYYQISSFEIYSSSSFVLVQLFSVIFCFLALHRIDRQLCMVTSIHLLVFLCSRITVLKDQRLVNTRIAINARDLTKWPSSLLTSIHFQEQVQHSSSFEELITITVLTLK